MLKIVHKRSKTTIFHLLDWQESKGLITHCVGAPEGKEALLYITERRVNWYNPYERIIGSIYQNYKRITL